VYGVTCGSQSDVKMLCTKDGVTGGSQSEGILASFLSSTVLAVEAFLPGNVMSEVDMSPWINKRVLILNTLCFSVCWHFQSYWSL
jgi:hypothetical protein